MTMDDISNVLQALGGLGMFLYGMYTMSDGLKKTAGERLKGVLGRLTDNRLLAVAAGVVVTALVQSSSAVTVLVVGFVNAGILSIYQATDVIMGANVGTTITAWLVSLGQLEDALDLFSPTFYAPLILAIGAFVLLLAKTEQRKWKAEIVIGLGFLFLGLDEMSEAIRIYRELPIISQAFTVLGKNPWLGILIGALVTVVIQSSSASIGILQTLAGNGVVSRSAAVFITMGANIGSTVTALLAGIGSLRMAKRAAMIHFLFNAAGTLLFTMGALLLFALFPIYATEPASAVDISMFQSWFNLGNVCILFPLAGRLVALSGILVRE